MRANTFYPNQHLQLFLSTFIGCAVGLALATPWTEVYLQPLAGAWLVHQLSLKQTTRHQLCSLACFLIGFLGTALTWIGWSIYRPPFNGIWTTVAICIAIVAWQVFLYLSCFVVTKALLQLFKLRPASDRTVVWHMAFVTATAFTAAEVLRSAGSFSLPWAFWSYGAIDNPLLRGFYPVGGSYLVTFMLWMLSALLLQIFISIRNAWWHLSNSNGESERKTLWRLLSTMLGFILLAVFLNAKEWTDSTEQSLTIRLVHTQWPEEEKYQLHNQLQSVAMLKAAPYAADADLTIFPELFLTQRIARLPQEMRQQLMKSTQDHQHAVLFGVVGSADVSVNNEITTRKQNALVLLDTEGRSHQYTKRLLIPFTEYLPHQTWLHWAWQYLYQFPLADLVPGSMSQPPMMVNEVHLGTLICSELSDPVLSALEGGNAGILAVPSSDSWIPSRLFLLQAHQLARIRAAELQKPVVRPNNVGFSAFIDHKGRVLASLIDDPGSGQWKINARTGKTPYAHMVNYVHSLLHGAKSDL